jgi:hypothetical protein
MQSGEVICWSNRQGNIGTAGGGACARSTPMFALLFDDREMLKRTLLLPGDAVPELREVMVYLFVTGKYL